MSSKYKIQISPNYSFSLEAKKLRLRRGLAGLLDLFGVLSGFFWFVFLVMLVPSMFFIDINDPGASFLLWMYAFVVILLFLQIAKRVLSSSDYLPTVSYDILLLTLTSVIALALFLSLLNSDTRYNIWGGADLRYISGISIIAFWFLYYVGAIFNQSNRSIYNVFRLLSLSVLIASILNLLAGAAPGLGFQNFMILSLPIWLWLFIYSKGWRWIFGLNALGSLLTLREFISNEIILVFVTASLSLSLTIVFKYKDSLSNFLSKGLKAMANGSFLKLNDKFEHKQFVFLLVNFITAVLGIVYLLVNRSSELFANIETGFANLDFSSGVQALLFGNGLVLIEGSSIFQFIHSYGLVGFLLLTVIIGKIIFDLMKQFFKDNDKTEMSLILAVMALLLISIFSYFFMTSTVLVTVMLWLAMSLAGSLRAIYVDQVKLDVKAELQKFASVKSDGLRKVLIILQIVGVLIILWLIIYFIGLLPTIQNFIS